MELKSTAWRLGSIVALIIGIASCSGSSVISDGRVYSYGACADGWPSQSIGIQGACSSHGGVISHEVDNRTDTQRITCYALNVTGFSLLLAALVLASGPFRPRGPKVVDIPIIGDIATVPLIIDRELRLVAVVRLDERTYETQDSVALVKCPERRRRSVYTSKIKFYKTGKDFRQDLSTWIYTGRGRAGGYNARAYSWSKYAPQATA
jgi:hypothetical protein